MEMKVFGFLTVASDSDLPHSSIGFDVDAIVFPKIA